jgi:hypothetical protein
MSIKKNFQILGAVYASTLISVGALMAPVIDTYESLSAKSNQAGFTATGLALVCNNPSKDLSNRAWKLAMCPMAAAAQLSTMLYTPFTGSPGSTTSYNNLKHMISPS